MHVPVLGEGAAAKVLDVWVESQDEVFSPSTPIIKSTQELYHSSSTGRWVTARVFSFFSGEKQPIGGERIEGVLYCGD